MTRGRVALGAGVGVVAVVVGVVVWLGQTAAPVATGYAAKIVCSGHFVSGRPVADVEGDLPDNPVKPLLSVAAHADEAAVTAQMLGLFSTTAWYTPGHGCTLADDPPDLQPDEPVAGGSGLWPAGEDVDPSAVDEATRQALDAAIAPAFTEDGTAEGQVRGTRAVVVVHEGRIVAERYAPGFDADTPLIGWSMSKAVASAAVGRLIGQGELALTDDNLLPHWADDERARITVEHLLHMTSGLNFEEIYDVGTLATEMLFTPGSTALPPSREPLVAPPGTRWEYSSGTTNILCEVARQAAGRPGPDMMDELVFEPLGMTTAVMEPDVSGLPVCSSFGYASARDWARFGQLYLQDGVWDGEQLLPEGWVDYSTTPVALDPELPYGAQWWLNEGTDGDLRMPSVPADAYWASGNEGQQTVVIPSEDLVVVRLGLTVGLDGLEWGLEPLLGDVMSALDGTA